MFHLWRDVTSFPIPAFNILKNEHKKNNKESSKNEETSKCHQVAFPPSRIRSKYFLSQPDNHLTEKDRVHAHGIVDNGDADHCVENNENHAIVRFWILIAIANSGDDLSGKKYGVGPFVPQVGTLDHFIVGLI